MAFKQTIRRQDKPRSGITHGGIGTGGVELRADGIFRNWNIFNNEPFGNGAKVTFNDDSMLFFKVRWQEEGKNPQMKLFQIEEGRQVGAIISQPHYYIFPWMTGVDSIEYTSTFPFTELVIKDSEMPFDIKIKAFSPFIPHDVKNSSLPAVIFDFEASLKGDKSCSIMLMASLRNAVGYDVEDKYFISNPEFNSSMTSVEMTCGGMSGTESSFGTMSIAAMSAERTSYYAGWEHLHPYYEKVLRCAELPNLNDTTGRVQTDPETKHKKSGDRCFSTVAASQTIKKRATMNASFIFTWNFPNLYATDTDTIKNRIEGNYYSNFFETSSDVVKYVATNKVDLTRRTQSFIDNFYDSDIPVNVLDQINSHFNTFISSSWLTKEMNFGIREGLTSEHSWGPLATTDVGMYGSIMPAALFPEINKNTFRAHKHLQHESGEIGHGISGNFAAIDESETVKSRLDMPSQYVLQTLRDYFWTNDKEYLSEMWESVKKALDYVLRERDMNHDMLPDMEGVMCSYDNFPMYGAASYIVSQWLAALRYAILAANVLGDSDAVARYSEALKTGSVVGEDKLWNGNFFRLYNDEGGARGDYDDGCLTDQLIGQWAADQIGAGELFNKEKTMQALSYIISNNYTDQYGLVNCRWPEDGFLHEIDKNCWNDQANTNWTGVELGFASLLIYQGLVQEGLMIASNVDERYRKFGTYYDHFEFGGHYYRPMSSWGIVNAMLGLSIQGTVLGFDPKLSSAKSNYYFAHGSGDAHFRCNTAKQSAEIQVHNGALEITELIFKGSLAKAFYEKKISILLEKETIDESCYTIKENIAYSTYRICFAQPISVKAETLSILAQ